ncbi:MAG: hypothetical protein QNL62_12770 [Gammaproteobacteria bacterium]|nr:hypothetical protein [Gammaproteobacteria bacterium]
MNNVLCDNASQTQLKQILDELMVLHDDIITRSQIKLDAIPFEWP